MRRYRVTVYHDLVVYTASAWGRNAAHACEQVVRYEEDVRGVDVERAHAVEVPA